MVVVIAPEKDIENEISLLNSLFFEGLEYFHFRKPEKSLSASREFLMKIHPEYRKHIITHYHHELAKELGLKGIHLQEQFRKDLKQHLSDYA
ncbi:MAG: thiamine phosphate synthase, partial [Flavobacteriaceae bacterium]|nr:thiamine phosphate synthase [Flavobacteriaceae bacterium]